MKRTLALLGLVTLLLTTLVAAPCGGEDPCENLTSADLRADTLTNGTPILDGITLEESTPIAEIVAAPDDFEGKLVQIEGLTVEVCSSQGCYVKIQDEAKNSLMLKVTDGVVDFREYVVAGNYMVGDGIFQRDGEHGAMVFIDDYGAMVGTITCATGIRY